jgi:hypothetical protein
VSASPAGASDAPQTVKRRWPDLLALYGAAVIVNGLVALLVRSPAYTDAFYYFDGGAALALGRNTFPDLMQPYIWNYINAPPALPVPGFSYWQPLSSFVTAAGVAVFRWMPPFGAAQALFVLLAGFIPLMAYVVALRLGERRHALLAGWLAVFSGIYVVYWSLPETFTPFALAGAGALLLAGAGRKSGRWPVWLGAGACAGLAHLTRADGLLLLPVLWGAAILFPRLDGESAPGSRVAAVGASLAGYLLVMAPWFARNLAVYGSIQAPGGLDTLWLVDYNEIFDVPARLSPAHYLSAGWRAIVGMKLEALGRNLLSFLLGQNLIFLLPLTLLAWVRRWRSRWLFPAMLYGLALFAAMTFAFTLPGMRGGWFHSSAALLPFTLACGALGLEDAIRWAAARLRGWNVRRAWRVFAPASVVLAVIVTATLIGERIIGMDDLSTVVWNQKTAVYTTVGDTLDGMGVPAEAIIMSNNPPGVYVHTGRWGIPLVNGDEADLLRVADRYGAGFLIVDKNVPEGLKDLYESGPSSDRLQLVAAYGPDNVSQTYFYAIEPPGE